MIFLLYHVTKTKVNHPNELFVFCFIQGSVQHCKNFILKFNKTQNKEWKDITKPNLINLQIIFLDIHGDF